MLNYQENITGRALIEPLNDFKIELNVTKTYSRSLTAFFKFDPDSNDGIFRDFGTPIEQGSYSITYGTWGTSFSKEGTDNISEVFKTFEQNRLTIAQRLAADPNRKSLAGVGISSRLLGIFGFMATTPPTRITINKKRTR